MLYLHVAPSFCYGALAQNTEVSKHHSICEKHRVTEHIAGYFLRYRRSLLDISSNIENLTCCIFGNKLAIKMRSSYGKSLKTLHEDVATARQEFLPPSKETQLPGIIF